MSVAQRLACDEFELFRCLFKAAGAMEQLFVHFEKEGLFKNVIEHVEKNVYDNRFGIFASLPFPRYKTFDEYQVEKRAIEAMPQAELLEATKQAFTEARGILSKLVATEDSQRCLALLPKAQLEQLQRTLVVNSMSLTKASMLSNNCRLRLVSTLPWLPTVEVDKK